MDANLSDLARELAERDRRDRERAASPLRPADDAVIIDTSGLGIEEVLDRVIEVARYRLPDAWSNSTPV
jgi:cytidylate kinase